MKNFNVNLINYITPEFLFFSWKQIKYQSKIKGMFIRKKFIEPPSNFWFLKTSYLIRSGQFYYFCFPTLISPLPSVSDNFLLGSLINLKLIIIQNAFLMLIKPFFYYSNTIFYNSSECLRI